jgi:hypothetical protein
MLRTPDASGRASFTLEKGADGIWRCDGNELAPESGLGHIKSRGVTLPDKGCGVLVYGARPVVGYGPTATNPYSDVALRIERVEVWECDRPARP